MAVGKPAGEEEEGKNFGGGLGGWQMPCEGEEQKLSFSRFFSFLCFWFPFSKITK